MKNLRVDKTVRDQGVELKFEGFLKESSVIPEVEARPDISMLWLNLEGLRAINSIGIKIWIDWIQGIKIPVTFEKVSTAFISHTGLVQGMIPNGASLDSFYVPYLNQGDGEIEYVLFEYGKQFSKTELTIPLRVSSQNNGAELKFQEMHDRFFRFLKIFYPKIKIS